jgi:hypothetical protein
MRLNQTQLQSNQPERGGMIYVAEASGYARRLVEDEARRNGQPIKVAARAVARRLKSSPSSIWSLLFRPPKQVSASLLFALHAAVERQIVREIEALNNELVSLRQKGRRTDPSTLAEVEESLARLRARLDEERAR